MGTKQMLVFVVEDDPIFNKLISDFLSYNNIGVIKSFLSGEKYLEKINEQPDIILLEYILPLKNRLEIMREVKKRSLETEVLSL